MRHGLGLAPLRHQRLREAEPEHFIVGLAIDEPLEMSDSRHASG
jgi:hypothetical protein